MKNQNENVSSLLDVKGVLNHFGISRSTYTDGQKTKPNYLM